MIEFIEKKNKKGKGDVATFLLHGYGSHEKDLIELSNFLNEDMHFFSLRAPIKVSDDGYAWFNLQFLENGDIAIESKQELKSAIDLIYEFIEDKVKMYRFDWKKVFIIGFSQGCVLGYLIALTKPDIKNIVGLSGYLLENTITIPTAIAKDSIRIFSSHGIFDHVIPEEKASRTAKKLAKIGVDVTYKTYPSAHDLCQENIEDLSLWIEHVLHDRS